MLRDLDTSKFDAEMDGGAMRKSMPDEKKLKCVVEHVMVTGLSLLLANGLDTPNVDQLPASASQ